MSVEAAKAGKDIWCEKPMTRTIGEGKRVMEAVQQYGRMFRLNTWFRFTDQFYGLGTPVKPLKKLVQSGLLGWPLKVTISAHTGFNWKFFWVGKEYLEPQPVPAELDYDMWLGPAPYKPYNPHRVHQTFRGYWDYDGGGLGDMGQHYIDPVQYILGKDDTSPIKVEVDAPQQHPDAVGTWRSITYTYDDGCQIVLWGGTSVIRIRRILPDRRVMFIKFCMRYSRLGEETCRFPRTRTSGYGLYRMCEDTPAFRPERKEWFPFGYYCQYGSSGSAFEPDAEFRSCKT